MTIPLANGLAQSNNSSYTTAGSSSLKLTKVTPYVIRTDPPHWGGGTWFFDEIVAEPFIWENGDLIVTDRPGIGIALDENKLEKYKV